MASVSSSRSSAGSDGGQENLLERRRGKRRRHAAGGMRQTGSGVSPGTGKYPMSCAAEPRRAGACCPCSCEMRNDGNAGKESVLTTSGKERTWVALLRRIWPADRGRQRTKDDDRDQDQSRGARAARWGVPGRARRRPAPRGEDRRGRQATGQRIESVELTQVFRRSETDHQRPVRGPGPAQREPGQRRDQPERLVGQDGEPSGGDQRQGDGPESSTRIRLSRGPMRSTTRPQKSPPATAARIATRSRRSFCPESETELDGEVDGHEDADRVGGFGVEGAADEKSDQLRVRASATGRGDDVVNRARGPAQVAPAARLRGAGSSPTESRGERGAKKPTAVRRKIVCVVATRAKTMKPMPIPRSDPRYPSPTAAPPTRPRFSGVLTVARSESYMMIPAWNKRLALTTRISEDGDRSRPGR